MPAPAWEDLDDFLSTDDFATTAKFSRAGVVTVPRAVGLFDDPTFNAQTGEYDIGASMPRFTGKAADLAGIKRNDDCEIDGVAYVVDHDARADGTGMMTVELSRNFDAQP